MSFLIEYSELGNAILYNGEREQRDRFAVCTLTKKKRERIFFNNVERDDLEIKKMYYKLMKVERMFINYLRS